MISSTSSSPAKPAIQPGKITWPDEQSVQQTFSLPSSVIYYISKNPSNPTVYLQLAQSCQYFFTKLPILIAKDFYEENGETRLCCSNADVKCEENNGKCCINVNIAKISSKIWLTDCLSIWKNSVSLLSSKLYQCDVNNLRISNQQLKFDDFKFMASRATEISLRNVKIINNHGNDVKVDAILGSFQQQIESFYASGSSLYDFTTFKNIAKLKNLSKLLDLLLCGIPEIEELENFITFIKKHKNILIFKNISEKFKNHLNAIIDTVIEDETLKCVIKYDNQDNGKFKIMKSRYLD